MGVPVRHADGPAHRRLIANFLNLLGQYQPIVFDDLDGSAGTEATLEFPEIPDWVRQITITVNGLSNSTTNNILIQLKDSAWVTTGYAGDSSGLGSAVNTTQSTAGILIRVAAAANTFNGRIVLTKMEGNNWMAGGVLGRGDATATITVGGSAPLSGTLTGIRLNANGGNFDAGSVGCRLER